MNIIKHVAIAPALAILTLAMSSCYIRISDETKQELKNSFRNREMMKEAIYGPADSLVYSPGEFHALDASIWVDIIFERRDGDPEVVIKSPTRTRDSIKVENVDGTLKIYFKANGGIAFTDNKEYIKVYAPSLDEISKGGSGDLTFMGTFKEEKLSVSSSGSGNLYLERWEVAGPVTLSKTGSGDVEASIKSQSLDVKVSGSGDVYLDGEATDVSLEKSGSGDLDASKLKAAKVTVAKSGSGDVSYNDAGVLKEI